MSTLSVTIGSPPPNATVGSRTFTVSGSLSLHTTSGRSLVGNIRVAVTFGVNGPVVAATVTNNSTWVCTGAPAAGIHPNSAITVFVTASAMLRFFIPADRSWDIEDISGSTSVSVILPGPVAPTLTVTPITSPIIADQLPKTITFTGSAIGHDAPILLVQYYVEGWLEGPYGAVNTGGNYASWSVTLPVPPGTHTLTFRAYDRFGTAQETSRTFTVQPQTPIVIPPGAKATLSGAPTTSSITSWTRLEPQCTNADMGTSSSARVFDPLWMMTRQWQMGEFQAEDTGTPVQARVRATSATLTRSYIGELPKPAGSTPTSVPAAPYDPARMPLEAIVERRRMRAADANDARMLAFAVEAGLHFLRMLELQSLSKSYRAEFIAKLALQPLTATTAAVIDGTTARYLQSMLGRAPDGRVLATLLRTTGAAQLVLDTALNIASADRPKVQQAATAWLTWYDTLYCEPAGPADDAWNPSRLEYAMSVGTRLSANAQDDITFSGNEIDGSPLDWSSFDVNALASLGTDSTQTFTSLVEATIPAPVSFHGSPAPRFWEMEDAKVAYGLVPVGPTDIAHLLMIEYASTYGNDWFLVPLKLPVGSVTRVDSLVVTDTFGVRSLVRPIGDPALPAPYFSMWQSAYLYPPANSPARIVSNRFFLPPTLGRSIDSAPLEDVLFMRDEMANLAWAIERSVENPIEQPSQRYEAADAGPSDPVTDVPSTGLPRYLLSSTVAPNWIPLLPVQLPNTLAPPNTPGQIISRLKKGAVLQPDGTKQVHTAVGEILNAAAELLLYDEEVSRQGVRVTRQRRLTRWTDGSTWLWTSFRNQVGKGEGSSGLQFDQLQPPDSAAPVVPALPPPSPQINTDAAAYTPGHAIVVSWSGLSTTTATDWVAYAPAGSPDTAATRWAYTGGTAAGNVLLEGTLTAGNYVARLFANDTYTKLAESAAFSVQPQTSSITTDAAAYTPGHAIVVSWSGLSTTTATDWVAYAPAGSPDTAATRWAYTGGTAAGNVLLEGTLTVGNYVARLFANDTYTKLAESAAFAVQSSIGALSPSSDTVMFGSSIAYTATLTNPGASLSNVVLQGWIDQGTARRAAGGSMVMCGAGVGVLPNGTFNVQGSIVASNTTGGTGTLVDGAATFELQLIVNGTVLETQTVAVTLATGVVPPPDSA